MAAANEDRELRERAWQLIERGDYTASADLLAGPAARERGGFILRTTYVTALMHLQLWNEAVRTLVPLREEEMAERRTIGTVDRYLAVCRWCAGSQREALQGYGEYVDMVVGNRKVPRGASCYAEDSEGYLEAAFLWYFAFRIGDDAAWQHATSILRALTAKRALGWRAALARFLLRDGSLDEVAMSVDGVSSMAELLGCDSSDIRLARLRLRLCFYDSVRRLSDDGDLARYKRDLEFVISLPHYHVDDERPLALHELGLLRLGTGSGR